MTQEKMPQKRLIAPDEDAMTDLIEAHDKAKLPAKRDISLNLEMFPGAKDAGDYHQVSATQAWALIAYAQRYGLDAWAGHVSYMYGKPYITEKGAMANAEKSKAYKGFSAVMAGKDERKGLNLKPDDLAWTCTVYRSDRDQQATEYGIVYDSELQELHKQVSDRLLRDMRGKEVDAPTHERMVMEKLSYLPLYRRPGHMAYIRAIRRAHLTAFPLAQVSPEGEIQEGGDAQLSTT